MTGTDISWLIHSPDLCPITVVKDIDLSNSEYKPGNCIIAKPLADSNSRQAPHTDSKSAYLDLKKGLAESLTAWDILPCTTDKAKVKLAIESDCIIFRP